MKMVYVCSPYKGNVEYNTAKAQGYCRFIYSKGAVPIAVHLHNTQFLDDNVSEERRAGMLLGLHMLNRCDEVWVFGTRISEGMEAEIKAAQRLGIPIQYYNDRCEQLDRYGPQQKKAAGAATPSEPKQKYIRKSIPQK